MKRLLRTLPIVLLISLSTAPVALGAKSGGSITGKIKNKDGETLLGAIITIFKQQGDGGTISFTRSDRKGAYSIPNLSPGSYYLQVSRDGYQPLTQQNVKIERGKTTMLDVILQEFLGFVVNDNDPRNWDFRTVVRSTSDRRLIFRQLPTGGDEAAGVYGLPPLDRHTLSREGVFQRGGTVHVASSAGLSGENYAVFPNHGRNGLLSNFAYAEPVSEHGRLIFAGQLNSGYDSLWRVKNIYNYRPEPGRDLKISLGYGRLSLNAPSLGSVGQPARFFSQENVGTRESGTQTLGFGFEAREKIMDPVSMEYGFDYSRVSYGTTRSVFSPLLRLIITPGGTWNVEAAIASRRVSDNNIAILPDGETINMMEPTYIAQIDGEVHLSKFKHAEVSLAKSLPDETSLEVAVYQDRMDGPGMPFLISRQSVRGRHSQLAQLTEDQSAQHGMRFVMSRRFLDFLSGSIAYVYGTGTALSNADGAIASDVLARDLLQYMQRSYYHSLTSEVHATIPRTKTNFTTVVRWHPGNPLSPIDLFYDRQDTLSRSVNFFIRQAIPLPEFMASAGRWEALVDVRNLLDQGKERMRTNDGDLILTRNPRSVRFGLNLNFY